MHSNKGKNNQTSWKWDLLGTHHQIITLAKLGRKSILKTRVSKPLCKSTVLPYYKEIMVFKRQCFLWQKKLLPPVLGNLHFWLTRRVICASQTFVLLAVLEHSCSTTLESLTDNTAFQEFRILFKDPSSNLPLKTTKWSLQKKAKSDETFENSF